MVTTCQGIIVIHQAMYTRGPRGPYTGLHYLWIADAHDGYLAAHNTDRVALHREDLERLARAVSCKSSDLMAPRPDTLVAPPRHIHQAAEGPRLAHEEAGRGSIGS